MNGEKSGLEEVSQHDRATGAAAEELNRRTRRRFILRLAGLGAGVVLFAGAAVYVAQDRAMVSQAIDSLRQASVLSVVALIGCVLANILLTGLLFSTLMSRYGRVGVIEMQALMAATTLLNYLPARPGLFGRVAYHRLVNGIAVRDAAKVIVGAIVLTMFMVGAMLGALGLGMVTNASALWGAGAIAIVPAVGLIDRRFRWIATAVLIRWLDVLVWAARYLLVFEIMGRPIGFDAALALAVISILASMVPFLSNGLGLREWGVGYAAPILADEFGKSAALTNAASLAADIVHRGIEIIFVAACGGLGLVYLSARKRGLNGSRTG